VRRALSFATLLLLALPFTIGCKDKPIDIPTSDEAKRAAEAPPPTPIKAGGGAMMGPSKPGG